MAIKLFKVDNFHYGIHQEFFIDGEDDLEQIENEYECELGDKAYTPDGTIYMRHSDSYSGDKWAVKSSSNNSNQGEGGLSPSILKVELNELGTTLNKTWAEISTADIVIGTSYGIIGYVTMISYMGGSYTVGISTFNPETGATITDYYTTDSENGYPTYQTSMGEFNRTPTVYMDQNNTLNRTWEEIVNSGFCVLQISTNSNATILGYLYSYGNDNGTYIVEFLTAEYGDGVMNFTTNASSGYPVYVDPNSPDPDPPIIN